MIKPWWQLLRAEHGLIVFMAVVVSQFVVTGRFEQAFLYPALGPLLITWGAFAWGDYFGLKSDAALKRVDRPLVSKKIKPRHALWAGIALMLAGLAATNPVGREAFALAAVYTLFAFAYDPILKKKPLLGNAFIASAMSVSFIYGNLAAQVPLDNKVVLYAAVAFLAGLGRELIITLRDVAGDKKIGATTLPMVLGAKKTVLLSTVLVYAAVALSLVPLLRPVHVAYIPLVILTDALFLLGTYYALLSQKTDHLNSARQLTLYGMLFGVLAFAALGLQ
ncbi:geranylgeranylglycerol-phosphate geranylgeranyltransferase [Candidatus Micrarchaeota archaeon]|nr:geranylgeranylglycerol-phosphate geranylgeranyltransferase [Candidatus Micrarchaeota archaeon]